MQRATVKLIGLNPYSNGRYSTSLDRSGRANQTTCRLNPYSNGRYSTSDACCPQCVHQGVVLILILMEDTLRDRLSVHSFTWTLRSLNPYSNGRYSTRSKNTNPSLLASCNSFKTKELTTLFKKQVLSKGLQRYK